MAFRQLRVVTSRDKRLRWRRGLIAVAMTYLCLQGLIAGSQLPSDASINAKLVAMALASAEHDKLESLRGRELGHHNGNSRAMYMVRGLETIAPATAQPPSFSCFIIFGPGERWLSCRQWGGRNPEPEARRLTHLIAASLPKSYRVKCGSGGSPWETDCRWATGDARQPAVALIVGRGDSGKYVYILDVWAEYK